VKAPRGKDAVDFACTKHWAAIRADLAPLAASADNGPMDTAAAHPTSDQ